MTTMLEKMAEAIGQEAGFTTKAGWSAYLPHARAALLAIREANERMVVAGVWCGSDGRTVFADKDEDAMRLAWKDIIDVVRSGRA